MVRAIITAVLLFSALSKVQAGSIEEDLKAEHCKSDNALDHFTVLGYVESEDEKDKETLGFLVFYKKTITRKEITLSIVSNVADGIRMTDQQALDLTHQAYLDGKEYALAGTPLPPNPEDKRIVQYRIWHDSGKPEAIEVMVRTRNRKGKRKKPVTLKVDWPRKEHFVEKDKFKDPPPPPFLKQTLIKKFCTTLDPGIKYSVLDYITAYDHILSQYYAFLVYTTTQSGNTTMSVGGNHATGTTLTASKSLRLCKEAFKDGKPYVTVGTPFSTSEGDPRFIEYRLYQENGKPTDFEIHIILRDKVGKATPPHNLLMDFPLDIE